MINVHVHEPNSLPSTGVAVFAEVSARLTGSQLQQLVPLSLPLLFGVHQSRLHRRTKMEILISTCRCSPTQISIIILFHYFHLHRQGYLLELYLYVAISDHAVFLLLMDSLVKEAGNQD